MIISRLKLANNTADHLAHFINLSIGTGKLIQIEVHIHVFLENLGPWASLKMAQGYFDYSLSIQN